MLYRLKLLYNKATKSYENTLVTLYGTLTRIRAIRSLGFSLTIELLP